VDPGEYLRGQLHGHLATVGRDGQPHVVPVTFWLNLDEDTIDIGGINFGATARAVEVRGTAEPMTTGGDRINPRFPSFADEWLRIRPARIVSWGMEGGTSGREFRPNARSVG
jgi:pyridoxamine 5'-phosphate oxidase family protein